MPQPTTSKERLTAKEREAKAFELRLRGLNYTQIAEELGCGVSNAHRLVTKVLERYEKQVAEDAAQLRKIELERLDTMQRAIYQKAAAGGLMAMDRILRIQERRARLMGLDSATKSEVSGPDGGPIPWATLVSSACENPDEKDK